MKRGVQVRKVLICIAGVLLFALPARAQVSQFTATPPIMDGAVGATEWSGAGTFALPHGTVYFLHNNAYLFVLFDSTTDNVHDANLAGEADWTSIGFDINRNGVGDGGIDVSYSGCRNGTFPTRSTLISVDGCSSSGCSATAALGAWGFGPSPASAANHSIWEYAIPLQEIQAQPGDILKISLGLRSVNPQFLDWSPFVCDYANYHSLQLIDGGATVIPTLGSWSLGLLAIVLAGVGARMVTLVSSGMRA